jgi:hypothetical protein
MVVAVRIVEGDAVLAIEVVEVQIAVGVVVTVWFSKVLAPEPPRRAIRCLPVGLLLSIAGVHWVVLASATAVSRVGDVDNPMRGTEWLGRH